MYSQTSDPIPDISSSVFLESGATQTDSFYGFLSDSDYHPANISTSERLGLETMAVQKFKEYPVARLKMNEFVENGKFLCNNANCQETFDKNRERK